MRLVDIRTHRLHEFLEEQPPPYAILSHRWGPEELSFKEVAKDRIEKEKNGYDKLVGACRMVARYGVQYLWIDTCCIDKRSSAELSEAINSMFMWYQRAQVCLAYLEDIVAGTNIEDAITKSIWFTRCWTLQELVAPSKVDFFDRDWNELGSRNSQAKTIRTRTGIPESVLTDPCTLGKCKIHEKMSWASARQATRIEDVAYSLLGLFNVHMPLIYGEGSRAFRRLQEEIIRYTDDLSFLASRYGTLTSTLLAGSPFDFADLKSPIPWSIPGTNSFRLSNIGLETDIRVSKCGLDIYGIAILYTFEHTLVLMLRKQKAKERFYRVGLKLYPYGFLSWSNRQPITILRNDSTIDNGTDMSLSRTSAKAACRFAVETPLPTVLRPVKSPDQKHHQPGYNEAQWLNTGRSKDLECVFLQPHLPGAVLMSWRVADSHVLWLTFFFDFWARPCLLFRRRTRTGPFERSWDKNMVFELAEQYPAKVKTQQIDSVSNHRETEMLRVEHEWSDSISFLCRGDISGSRYGRIPPDLLPSGFELWVYFVRPMSTYNSSDSWLLKITSEDGIDWPVLHPERTFVS